MEPIDPSEFGAHRNLLKAQSTVLSKGHAHWSFNARNGTPSKKRSYNVVVSRVASTGAPAECTRSSGLRVGELLVSHDFTSASGHNAPHELSNRSTMMFFKPQSPRVFTDLVEAEQNGRGHIQRVFGQSKWQKDKDHLLKSMAYHLQKHKPSVRLTQDQTTRKSELCSQERFGRHLLQQRLTKQYGMKNMSRVEIPPESKLFLSEVPTLMAAKEKADC